MKDLTRVIRRPLITERGTMLREKYNQYLFEVDPAANKKEIKQAVEEYIPGNITVVKVQTMNVRGKIKRMGRFSGKRADWKKAIVTLSEDSDTIDFFDGV